MNNSDLFSCDLTLPYSAVNANGRIKADWLLNAFQDAASRQCRGLGISGFDMAKNLKWVVAQYRIKIQNQMEWISMTPLKLKTWRAPFKNLYEIRRFALVPHADAGQVIPSSVSPLVTATSVWILIKAGNGKPVRLTPHMPPHLMQKDAEPTEMIKPPREFGDVHHEIRFPVRFLDLDLNQHVNNRVYLAWAVDAVPEPYCFEYAPIQCDVVYRKEGLFGDRIASRMRMVVNGTKLATDHTIVNETSGDELARLSLTWEKLTPFDYFGSHDT